VFPRPKPVPTFPDALYFDHRAEPALTKAPPDKGTRDAEMKEKSGDAIRQREGEDIRPRSKMCE